MLQISIAITCVPQNWERGAGQEATGARKMGDLVAPAQCPPSPGCQCVVGVLKWLSVQVKLRKHVKERANLSPNAWLKRVGQMVVTKLKKNRYYYVH